MRPLVFGTHSCGRGPLVLTSTRHSCVPRRLPREPRAAKRSLPAGRPPSLSMGFSHRSGQVPLIWHDSVRLWPKQASLQAAQKLLAEHLATVKAVDGVQSVQRVVCGGCLDFKVVTAVSADKYGDWEAAGHAPEAAFLEAAKAIPGVTAVSKEHSASAMRHCSTTRSHLLRRRSKHDLHMYRSRLRRTRSCRCKRSAAGSLYL